MSLLILSDLLLTGRQTTSRTNSLHDSMQFRRTSTSHSEHTLVKPTKMSQSPYWRMQGSQLVTTDISCENLRLYDQTWQRSVQMPRSLQWPLRAPLHHPNHKSKSSHPRWPDQDHINPHPASKHQCPTPVDPCSSLLNQVQQVHHNHL